MTYPDRESPTRDRQLVIVIIAVLMLIYLAYAADATFRQTVCISAAQVEMGGSVTSTPIVCR